MSRADPTGAERHIAVFRIAGAVVVALLGMLAVAFWMWPDMMGGALARLMAGMR